MKRAIQILLVDDHQVVRAGLRSMLELEEDLRVVGEAADAQEALNQVALLSPEIILMDIKMPMMNGIELTRQVKQKKSSCKVIMLTLYEEYLSQAMEAGATGYLIKDISRQELVRAIKQVKHGEVVIGESITYKPRREYKERVVERVVEEAEEGSDTLFEEVQLVIPPPVEASQLMRFASQVEEIFQSRVLQVVGSWQEGTAITIILPKAIVLEDILNKLGLIPEIEETGEKPLTEKVSPSLLKKAAAVPRIKNRFRKTIFVTLAKNCSGVASQAKVACPQKLIQV